MQEKNMNHTVTIIQGDNIIKTTAEIGESLYAALARAGIAADFPCGGRKKCAKCLCEARGGIAPPDEAECGLLRDTPGKRLACFAVVEGDCEVVLPSQNMRILSESLFSDMTLSPGAPRLSKDAYFGAAVDIGTTTVVLYLYDLDTGRRAGVVSGMNAQKAFGADVISRMSYCMENEGGLARLSALIRGQINGMLGSFGELKYDIGELTVAGNTVMQHIFAGIDPSGMAAAPFTPATLFGDFYTPGALGVDLDPGARVYMLPAVAGYVGGDITAAIVACGLDQADGFSILIDLGTNGEMAAGGKDRLVCCAVAAGPAFEGADISCGMAGVEGAISALTYKDSAFECEVIGGGKPLGLCGSGLIDAIAALLDMGAVDETGRLIDVEEAGDAEWRDLLDEDDEGMRLRICDGVYITGRDVRKLQLAKAAVAAGIATLLDEFGKTAENIDNLFIAGGFGSHVDKDSAVAIGLIPQAALGRTISVGNAAGAGASLALRNEGIKKRLADLQGSCEYIELSSSPEFMEHYVENMGF